MNVLICMEDEKYMEFVLESVKSFQCDEEMVIDSYTEASWLMHMLKDEQSKDYDLAFLGEMIKGESGFDLGRLLKRNNPDCLLIYTCDGYDYMHEGFRVQAFQMFLKSQRYLVEEELIRAWEEYKRIHFQVVLHTRDGKVMKFYPMDIQYIETNNKRNSVVTDLGRYYGKIENFIETKEELMKRYFFQVHPRYFVNIGNIDLIRNGELIMLNGDYVPTSAMNKEIINDAIQAYAPLL